MSDQTTDKPAEKPADQQPPAAPAPSPPEAPAQPQPPGPPVAQDEQVSPAFVAHIQAILAGQAQPRSKASNSLLDRLRQQSAQSEAVARELGQVQQHGVNLKTKLDQLQGATALLLTLLKDTEGDAKP